MALVLGMLLCDGPILGFSEGAVLVVGLADVEGGIVPSSVGFDELEGAAD